VGREIPPSVHAGSTAFEKVASLVYSSAVAHSIAPRRATGAVIAGIAAIPFVSVTMVSVLADIASTTDASVGVGGLGALGAGFVMGFLVRQVIGAVRAGLSIGRIAIERLVGQNIVDLLTPVRVVATSVDLQRLPVTFVPAIVGRRGPPARIS